MSDWFTAYCLKRNALYCLNNFSVNKVAVLFSVDLLYYVCIIVLLEIFRQARAACGPRILCWLALVNIMNLQMFMAKGHICYCELVRWFAGSLVR